MIEEHHGNLIHGSWEPSVLGGRIEQRAAREPWSGLGSWPTSGPEDVSPALAALVEGGDAWRDTPRSIRLARLGVAARELAREPRGLAAQAARLGLGQAEVAEPAFHAERLTRALSRLRLFADDEGVALLDVHWSELGAGLFARAARALMSGSPVLIVGDARLPMAADRVARALLAGGIPAECVGLLHGLRRDGLQFAIGDRRVVVVGASAAEPERIRWLRGLCDDAGVARPELRLLRAGSLCVGPEDAVDESAGCAVDLAFGRNNTLSGQSAGQVARVFCHRRVFSRFTEALLAALATSTAARFPLPVIDRDAFDRVREQWAVGLDEGAVLIAGGEIFNGDGKAVERRLVPAVFTNVESHMNCAARQAPMPILCLLRINSGLPENTRTGAAPP